jgi:hypothetical protein
MRYREHSPKPPSNSHDGHGKSINQIKAIHDYIHALGVQSLPI